MGKERQKRSGRQAESVAAADVAKITVRLTALTAKRLGVEAVMTGRSQSDIVESVLAQHLAGWRLPSKTIGVGTPPESSDLAAAS